MRIAFDLDGVLADFAAVAIRAIRQLYRADLPAEYRHVEWNFSDILTTEQWEHVFNYLLEDPYLWERIPAFEENVQALHQYMDAHGDKDVYFITSRKNCVGASAVSQTQLWLMDQGFNFHNLSVVKSSKEKEQHLRDLGIQFFIDDLAPTIAQCQVVESCRSVLLDQPYNRYASHLPRVFSVAEFLLEAEFADHT